MSDLVINDIVLALHVLRLCGCWWLGGSRLLGLYRVVSGQASDSGNRHSGVGGVFRHFGASNKHRDAHCGGGVSMWCVGGMGGECRL